VSFLLDSGGGSESRCGLRSAWENTLHFAASINDPLESSGGSAPVDHSDGLEYLSTMVLLFSDYDPEILQYRYHQIMQMLMKSGGYPHAKVTDLRGV
jgi:hypothetical protein